MNKGLLTALLVLITLSSSLFTKAQTSLLGNLQWGQENPYNLKCPVMNTVVYQGSADKRAHTGCVATAMSQLMRYWQWPIQPTGFCVYQSVDSKDAGNNIFNIYNNLENHQYDWSMMPEDYHNVTDSDRMYAVAQLMFDCGSTVNMQYTSYTSDAGHIVAGKALTEHFSYFKDGMQLWLRNTTSDSTWHKVIKTEIEAGRPILIEGFGWAGGFGHEYIIDGYEETNDEVHVNFGFENTGGWYPMYEHSTYTANFGIITGIRPNKTGEAVGSFTPNIHRLNDMQYRDKSIHFRLRNDGLGQATAASNIYAALAVVREGRIVGLAANSSDGTLAMQQVIINCTHDEGYDFSPLDMMPVGTVKCPDVSGVTFSPSDVAVRSVSALANKINAGDILVPLVSTDGGKTFELADGNETHINSLMVTLDPTPEPTTYNYRIVLYDAPYTPGGIHPYIIYNDGYGDAYWYDEYIEMSANLKATDIKAYPRTGYTSEITIVHDGDTHEIHVTYKSTTGIKNLPQTSSEAEEDIYNLNGQRITRPTNGVFISKRRKINLGVLF